MLKKTLALLCAVMLLTMVTVTGCGEGKTQTQGTPGTQAPATINPDPKAVTIGTSTMGGAYYVIGTGMAAVITKYTGVAANAQATSGALQNCNMMEQGKAELAMIVSDSAYDITHKQGDFSSKDYPVMMVSRGGVNDFHLVVKTKSGIKTAADLKGKVVAWEIPGAPLCGKAFRALLEVYGMSEKDIKSQTVTPINDAATRLKEGKIDAIFYPSMGPAAAFVELATTEDICVVPIPEDKCKMINEKVPFLVPSTIPANQYKGQTEAVTTVGGEANLVAHKGLSEDFVYKITKTLFEHATEVSATHPGGKYFVDINKAATQDIMQYHPGAIKYYKERGVWKEPKLR